MARTEKRRREPMPVHVWWARKITGADCGLLRGMRISAEVRDAQFICARCANAGCRECRRDSVQRIDG